MDYTKGRNLYALDTSVNGYLHGSGTYVVSMSSYYRECTSSFIPVISGEKITIQSWNPLIEETTDQPWIGYAFYSDENMNAVIGQRAAKYGGQGSTYLTYTGVIIPDEAKYIRVSFRRFTEGYCKLEYGSEATEWRPAPEDDDFYQILETGGWNL